MAEPVLIGVDASTTAVKAIAWDREGGMVAEAREPLPLNRPSPGRFEQDAEDWWTALCRCLRRLEPVQAGHAVAALAIAHQRETVVPVDAAGDPVGPALLWLDSRAEAWIERLRIRIGDDTLRCVTGKTPNYGLSLYKIAWLRDREPERFRRAAGFLDVQAFLAGRLTGRHATSHSGADPTGLFDIGERRWSAALCDAAGLAASVLPEVVAPGAAIGLVHGAAAEATGLPAGTPMIAAGGDGQTAGLGVGAVRPRRAYLNLGTAVVAGVYSSTPVVDAAWRTLCGGGARGYYLESSLRSGALLSDWYLKRICGIDPGTSPAALERLEDAAAAVPPGSDGLVLLPYWQGVMNPHWDEHAHGAILGLSADHDRAGLYRALIEGIALEQALFLEAARERAGAEPHEVIAMGGPAMSALWCRVLADVLEVPILRSASVEAASLGAAMCAAAGAGLYPTTEAAADAMVAAPAAVFLPDPAACARYRQLRTIYADVYGRLKELLHRLDAFRRQG